MSTVRACGARPTLVDLPDDVILAVATWLCRRDLIALGHTTRRMHGLCGAPSLWRTALASCTEAALAIPTADTTLYLTLCNNAPLNKRGLWLNDRCAFEALASLFGSASWVEADARLADLSGGAKYACACRANTHWRVEQPRAAVVAGAPSSVEISTWVWMWRADCDAVHMEIRRGAVDSASGHLEGIGLRFTVTLSGGVMVARGALGEWHDGKATRQIAVWDVDLAAPRP